MHLSYDLAFLDHLNHPSSINDAEGSKILKKPEQY